MSFCRFILSFCFSRFSFLYVPFCRSEQLLHFFCALHCETYSNSISIESTLKTRAFLYMLKTCPVMSITSRMALFCFHVPASRGQHAERSTRVFKHYRHEAIWDFYSKSKDTVLNLLTFYFSISHLKVFKGTEDSGLCSPVNDD